jgi:DNA-binding LacI/PurR family transcriptional regulator
VAGSIAGGHDRPFTSAPEFLRAFLAEGATAVITYDHRLAIMLSGVMGIRIPDGLSILCFNDVFPVGILHPPLTAVAGHEMARIGASLLLNKLSATRSQATEVRVAEDLVVRGSTARPSGGEGAGVALRIG